jgi:hypothetical protein
MTSQSPGAMPYTHDVADTGPDPGTTPATVSMTAKASRGVGRPVIPLRLPEIRTVAA